MYAGFQRPKLREFMYTAVNQKTAMAPVPEQMRVLAGQIACGGPVYKYCAGFEAVWIGSGRVGFVRVSTVRQPATICVDVGIPHRCRTKARFGVVGGGIVPLYSDFVLFVRDRRVIGGGFAATQSRVCSCFLAVLQYSVHERF